MHLKFSHGGPCNIVPGPRGLTGTAKRLFLDLCSPDILIQGVVVSPLRCRKDLHAKDVSREDVSPPRKSNRT